MDLRRTFTPVLAKHTKNLSLVDTLSVGVDRMQRNFEPMRKQVEAWKGTRLPDETAKLFIYRAFVEGQLDAPKHLARRVHDQYFNPPAEEFAPRTLWSLSNSFTGAFKDLDPIPQFQGHGAARVVPRSGRGQHEPGASHLPGPLNPCSNPRVV